MLRVKLRLVRSNEGSVFSLTSKADLNCNSDYIHLYSMLNEWEISFLVVLVYYPKSRGDKYSQSAQNLFSLL